MESPWKPLLLLSVIGGLSEFSGALGRIPAAYGAEPGTPTDSSPSSPPPPGPRRGTIAAWDPGPLSPSPVPLRPVGVPGGPGSKGENRGVGRGLGAR
ncbi:hypothetical protein ANANG_G00241240 [Anguilla anguilla]|uniref:Uncharacterized protein n=1 Tax=Anguilla anguilla TaxID=7936 RepID=A0A9D3RNW0_ANGAN|nr:hypothetical protein ANANG_G00241240 [Anguilla anguilla]